MHLKEPLRLEHVTHAKLPIERSLLFSKDSIHGHEITFADIREHLPRLTPELLAEYPPEHILFFHTRSARFKISLGIVRDTTNEDRPTGASQSFYIPGIEDQAGHEVGKMCKAFSAGQDSYVELIEVGRREDPSLPVEIMPPQVLVLQIDRDENDLASRVNIGELTLDAWESACPAACLVALH